MSVNEDKEFEAELAEARFNKIRNAIRNISVSLRDGDDTIVEAIEKHIGETVVLAEAIKNIPKPEIVKIPEVNQEELINSIKQISINIIDSNNKVIEALENRMLPSSFSIIKKYGVTDSVNVNYKQAKQLK